MYAEESKEKLVVIDGHIMKNKKRNGSEINQLHFLFLFVE